MVAGQIALLTAAMGDHARYPGNALEFDHYRLFELARWWG
jgi:hypothetical protein